MTERYTCLFGGGAIRGIAYAGAVRALEEMEITYDIVGGSSVGSIIAALIACGFNSDEIEASFMDAGYELFRDIHFGLGKPLALSKGEIFTKWINDLITEKAGNLNEKKTCFKDIPQKLVIMTTDLNNFKPVEFSYCTAPDFEIARAVRISSGMPGLMAPYEYGDLLLADGDLQKASPMWRLSATLNNSESRILEFRLEGASNKNQNSPISYINTIYSCVTDAATDFITELYGNNDRYDCIKINTGDVFFADLNLKKEERKKLINTGYEQTINYFKTVLPAKKRRLAAVYTAILSSLKKAQKGLHSNNADEVSRHIGEMYVVLCENKEIIDPLIYNNISLLKAELKKSVISVLFFKARFKGLKRLEVQMADTVHKLRARIAELKFRTDSP